MVVDDAGMEITDVIRGEDHITNTARQMMIFAALGKPAPRFGHHSLILAPDGSKLSKRHGATSVAQFRGLGYLPAAIVNYLALISWHPHDEREKFSMAELIEEFEIERVSKSPAIFDLQKLNWLNGLYIRDLSPKDLFVEVAPYLADARMAFAPVQQEVVAEAIQANLGTLSDAPQYAEVFWEDADPATCAGAPDLTGPDSHKLFELAKEHFGRMPAEFLPAPRPGNCCVGSWKPPKPWASRARQSTIRCGWR